MNEKKILVLEGGLGVKSLIHIKGLIDLCASKNEDFLNLFDIFCGSGMSAVILAALAIPENKESNKPAYTPYNVLPVIESLIKIYDKPFFRNVGHKLFKIDLIPRKIIENELYNIFGDFKIGDLLKPVLIPFMVQQKYKKGFNKDLKIISNGDVEDHLKIYKVLADAITVQPYTSKFEYSKNRFHFSAVLRYNNMSYEAYEYALKKLKCSKVEIFYFNVNSLNICSKQSEEKFYIKELLEKQACRHLKSILENNFHNIRFDIPYIDFDDVSEEAKEVLYSSYSTPHHPFFKRNP